MQTAIKNRILKQKNLRKLNKLQQDTVGKIAHDKDKDFKYIKLKKKVKVEGFTKKWETDIVIFQTRK